MLFIILPLISLWKSMNSSGKREFLRKSYVFLRKSVDLIWKALISYENQWNSYGINAFLKEINEFEWTSILKKIKRIKKNKKKK